jgi:nicotinamide-nucleotide amidase
MTAVDSLAADLVADLVRRGTRVATAESLTGGLLAARLVSVPGASRVFVGGVVAYSAELKVSLLGVRPELIEIEGMVSAACARAMADGVRTLTGATYAVSTTGVAGPEPLEGKPIGTVYVGVAGPVASVARSVVLIGDRQEIRRQSCDVALGDLGQGIRASH